MQPKTFPPIKGQRKYAGDTRGSAGEEDAREEFAVQQRSKNGYTAKGICYYG